MYTRLELEYTNCILLTRVHNRSIYISIIQTISGCRELFLIYDFKTEYFLK